VTVVFYKTVDICFYFCYEAFKTGRYHIPKKGGGSREPLPFCPQYPFSTSLLLSLAEIPLPSFFGNGIFLYLFSVISSAEHRKYPNKKPKEINE